MSVKQYDKQNRLLKLIAGGTLWADCPIGTINAYGGATAPDGWMLCQGQAISRTDYADLFNVIGTSFGSGDGSTTFNVPDLREKFPEGASNDNPLGTRKWPGLPDIHGTIRMSTGSIMDADDTSGTWGNGAFSEGVKTSENWRTVQAGITALNNAQVGQYFSASKSNTIYGSSNTVQPAAICINFIIKAKQTPLPADLEAAIQDIDFLTWGDNS